MMKKEAVIVIAVPQASEAERIASVFAAQGFRTHTASGRDATMEHLENAPVSVVLCAYTFERDSDGLDVLASVRRQNPGIAVIMLADRPDLTACKR